MVPAGTDATRVTACGVCAAARTGIQRTTRAPTAAAIHLDASVMVPPGGRRAGGGALPGGNGEIDVPCQRLVCQLVGDLDLETVVALWE